MTVKLDLSLQEIEAVKYLKFFAEELHLERGDLPPEHGQLAQIAITVLERLLAKAS